MKRKKIKKVTIPENIGRRYFKVYDAVFGRRVHVLLNHTPEQYAKWLNKVDARDVGTKDFDDFAGFSSTIAVRDKPTEFLIYVRHFNWAIKCQGTLIHEIVHTVIKIWDSNNIPHTYDTQEFLAHSIGNMYEDIARKLLVPLKDKK